MQNTSKTATTKYIPQHRGLFEPYTTQTIQDIPLPPDFFVDLCREVALNWREWATGIFQIIKCSSWWYRVSRYTVDEEIIESAFDKFFEQNTGSYPPSIGALIDPLRKILAKKREEEAMQARKAADESIREERERMAAEWNAMSPAQRAESRRARLINLPQPIRASLRESGLLNHVNSKLKA